MKVGRGAAERGGGLLKIGGRAAGVIPRTIEKIYQVTKSLEEKVS